MVNLKNKGFAIFCKFPVVNLYIKLRGGTFDNNRTTSRMKGGGRLKEGGLVGL